MAQTSREVPLGGRTATMGGAGTAAGNDSAMPFLNPAGMAGIPGDIFAVSASIYGYSNRDINNFFQPNGYDPATYGPWTNVSKVKATSVTDLPSSVMYFQHVGKPEDAVHHVYGLSLIIPVLNRMEIVGTNQVNYPRITGTRTQSASVVRRSTDYYVGPSYALSIDNSFRFGVSAYALYNQNLNTMNVNDQLVFAGGSLTEAQKYALSAQEQAISLVVIAGIQAALADHFWFGLGVACPSIHLTGSGVRSFESGGTANDYTTLLPTSNSTASNADSVAYRANRPLRINAGLAYDDRKSFSLAGDVQFYAARSDAAHEQGVSSVTQTETGETARAYTRNHVSKQDYVQMIDVSVGAEVVLTDATALRFGGFTQLTNLPDLDPYNDPLYTVRENRFGGTAGLGLTMGTFDTTLGLAFAYGKGKVVVPDWYSAQAHAAAASGAAVSNAIVDTSSESILLILSGAVTTQEAQDTIRKYAPVQVPTPSLPRPQPPRQPAPRPPVRTQPPVSPSPPTPTPPVQQPPVSPPPLPPAPAQPPEQPPTGGQP